MSFDPELAVCRACRRRGCWTEEVVTVTDDGEPPRLFKEYTCKCGNVVEGDEVKDSDPHTAGFVGGMGAP